MDWIQVLMGAIGSVGFAVLFQLTGKKLLLFFCGGALDWAVYLLCIANGSSPFLAMLLATVTAALSSELLARVIRVPVLIILVPMLIPLVPGGSLYYTMSALVRGDSAGFASYGQSTVLSASAIALGIIGVSSLVHLALGIQGYFRRKG